MCLLRKSLSKSPDQKTWQIFAACCLQRPPIVSKEFNDIEKKFYELLQKKENELSYLSDFERQLIKESKLKKDENQNNKQKSLLTAQEVEDKYIEERKKFQPASRDTNLNENSAYKNLDEKLFLFTPQHLGQKLYLICPTQSWKVGETLLQTADRAFQSAFKNSEIIRPLYTSNAPMGFYHYKYPKPVKNITGYLGAKMFFFLAYVKPKDFQHFISKSHENHKWLTKKEMKNILHSKYYKALEPIVLSE